MCVHPKQAAVGCRWANTEKEVLVVRALVRRDLPLVSDEVHSAMKRSCLEWRVGPRSKCVVHAPALPSSELGRRCPSLVLIAVRQVVSSKRCKGTSWSKMETARMMRER